MLRDGFHQDAVHGGVAPYRPNSLDGGCPFVAGSDDHPFIDMPVPLAAASKIRQSPVTFDDHYSQAGMFYRSLAPVEQDHVVAAYTFELSKCYQQVIAQRQLLALANIDGELCQRVATGLGLDAPAPTLPPVGEATTAAISQIGGSWPVAGRIVGIVIGADSNPDEIRTVQGALVDSGVLPLVVGPHGGEIGSITTHRTYANAASIEFDAFVVVGDTPPAPDAIPSMDAKSAAEEGPATGIDPRVSKLIAEAWRHAKAIGTTPSAAAAASVLPANAPGIVRGEPTQVAAQIVELLAAHRAWERFPTTQPA
jgi:catalase